MTTSPRITGVVTDAASRPVEDARVLIARGPLPVEDVATLTDSEGAFSLPLPGPGAWVITVAADLPAGPASRTLTVEVRAHRRCPSVRVRLVPDGA